MVRFERRHPSIQVVCTLRFSRTRSLSNRLYPHNMQLADIYNAYIFVALYGWACICSKAGAVDPTLFILSWLRKSAAWSGTSSSCQECTYSLLVVNVLFFCVLRAALCFHGARNRCSCPAAACALLLSNDSGYSSTDTKTMNYKTTTPMCRYILT